VNDKLSTLNYTRETIVLPGVDWPRRHREHHARHTTPPSPASASGMEWVRFAGVEMWRYVRRVA
jgi:fatty-acid desaturase